MGHWFYSGANLERWVKPGGVRAACNLMKMIEENMFKITHGMCAPIVKITSAQSVKKLNKNHKVVTLGLRSPFGASED